MDTPTAFQMAQVHHKNAIKLLNGQIVHHLGKEKIAVNFAPWGTATLRRQAIGTLI